MTTTLPTVSTAEVIGRLIEQIGEVAGPDTSMLTHTSERGARVDVIGVNPDRFPEWNADEPFAAVKITTARSGLRMISADSHTLVRALQLVASVMAFPPESGATLRLVPNGGA